MNAHSSIGKKLESFTSSENEIDSWFSLADSFCQFENITEKIQGVEFDACPFDNDPASERFFEELARGLHKKLQPHVLVRRERGVGEYAIITEFARKANNGLFEHLESMQIVRVDCRFTPPELMRDLLFSVFSKIAQRSDIVLILDGFASLLDGHGAAQNRPLLLSLLASTPCRVVAVVTPQEFDEHFAGRPDTDEFFSNVELNEPSIELSEKLIRHFAIGLSGQYEVEISEEVAKKVVRLSHMYMPSTRLPSKALKVLSDICDDIAFDRASKKSARSEISVDDVINKISKVSGVPASTLAGLPDGVNYQEALKSRIVGQDHVITEVAAELGMIRAGMVDVGKPATVMLFVGQTGTGKTELAKVISQLYSASKRLKTFTLGNYSEPHSVSGIIGVPAGYVGHDQGGRLVNELNTDPYSVFLLDEADKAHPDVMQPFLNLFDEGWIVDQRGVKGYAERAVFILTTNVGQRQISEMHKNGKSWDEIQAKLMEMLSNIRHPKAARPVFTAEFLARLKKVIIFKPLDADAMSGITQQLCSALTEKWKTERQKQLVIHEEVIEAIAEHSDQKNEKSKGKEGGRIVRKLIASVIESNLQKAIADSPNRYRESETIMVRLKDKEIPSVELTFQ